MSQLYLNIMVLKPVHTLKNVSDHSMVHGTANKIFPTVLKDLYLDYVDPGMQPWTEISLASLPTFTIDFMQMSLFIQGLNVLKFHSRCMTGSKIPTPGSQHCCRNKKK